MNFLLIFETSNVHIEVPQCLNIEDTGTLDLNKLTIQQVFRARKWAKELNLSYFRQSVSSSHCHLIQYAEGGKISSLPGSLMAYGRLHPTCQIPRR